MAKDHSFDIVSEVDLQEVTNAVDQSKKEVATRYDFKGSDAKVDWNKSDKKITLDVENDIRLKALSDIIQNKFIKRQVSLKSIDFGQAEKSAGGRIRQVWTIKQGISTEKAKEIVKFIKQSKIKVQASIQQEQVRVTSGKIDFLQEIIQKIKSQDFGLDLQFINYR